MAADEPPLISFVIVTMNRRESLRQAVESAKKQQWPNKEIIVVDNASSDGTAEMLQAEYPEIALLRQAYNLGASGGKNVGMNAAKGDYIVCFDDDVRLQTYSTGALIQSLFAEDAALGCVSFHLLNPQGESEANLVPRRDKTLPLDDVALGYFLGGACAFRKTALENVGVYWDVLNPYGAEEFDLSYRLLEAGYIIRWAREIRALHDESTLSRPSGRKVYALARNYPLVAMRHLPGLYVLSHCLLWWGYALILALRQGALRDWFKGVIAGCSAMPQAFKCRRVISTRSIRILRQTSGPLWF